MRPIRRIFLSLGFFAIASAAIAADPVTLTAPTPTPKTGDQLRAELGLSGVSGWMLIDMDSGRVLDSSNAARAFVPASVAKLPTAAFALDALGPNHRFETRLLANGTVKNGRLAGDLVLQGGGNPELDTDALADLAQQLSQRGVRQVTGALIADGSALVQVPEIESAQAEDSSYNPSVSGLNLNFNRVHVKWDARRGRDELSVEAAAARLSPAVQHVSVNVSARPGQRLFALDRRGGREHWQMARRAYRGRAARWLPVKQPEAYAADVFRTLAQTHGIALGPSRTDTAPRQAQLLTTHQSRPLGNILRDMLRYSTNLTAEVTGAAATRSVGVEAHSLAESADVMNAWAASVGGFPVGDPGFRFVNHSGLTTGSRVSPQRMVQLLAAFARRQADPTARHGRLPGGIAGYLKPHNVAAEDFPLDYDRLAVVAKTGTMSYIRGLAGYIATPGGRQLAFAIFSNDLAARGGGAQKVNKRWMGRAKGFERALIRNWVLRFDQGA